MEIGVDGENGQDVLQIVELGKGKGLENVTTQELKEKENIALMMAVDLIKSKTATVNTIVQSIKVNYINK